QDPPEVIPQLLAKAKEGHDIVFAKRQEKKHSLFRRFAADLYFKLLSRITHHPFKGEYGSFSLISRKVITEFLQVRDKSRHYLFILYWLGFDTAEIEYEHAERFSGESSYTLRSLIRHSIAGVFFQTTTLLRWIV